MSAFDRKRTWNRSGPDFECAGGDHSWVQVGARDGRDEAAGGRCRRTSRAGRRTFRPPRGVGCRATPLRLSDGFPRIACKALETCEERRRTVWRTRGELSLAASGRLLEVDLDVALTTFFIALVVFLVMLALLVWACLIELRLRGALEEIEQQPDRAVELARRALGKRG